MKPEDKQEIFRLTEHLREISLRADITLLQMEAIKKAGFALIDSFLSGKREMIELQYQNLPLTEQQKEQLRSYGIDPDSDKAPN
jgi:hypothetical protein